jgi:hypothetical protein
MVLDNLLTLKLGCLTPSRRFVLGLAGTVLTGNSIAVQLITDCGRATANGTSNCSYAITFVM